MCKLHEIFRRVTFIIKAQPQIDFQSATETTNIFNKATDKETFQQIIPAFAVDAKNQEERDSEVSQTNAQLKNVDQTQKTYSRPMSRTSSKTPGMQGKEPEIVHGIASYEATSTEQLSLRGGRNTGHHTTVSAFDCDNSTGTLNTTNIFIVSWIVALLILYITWDICYFICRKSQLA